MKLRRKMLIKIALGLVLLVVAGIITYVFKEILSAREPVNALPVIRVEYNERELPRENVLLTAYSWRFLNATHEEVLTAPEAWRDMKAAPVNSGMPLNISFSFKCRELIISRKGESDADFRQITVNRPVGSASGSVTEIDPGSLRTPTETGIYTYRVEANWGVKGSVLYYFKLDVVF